MHAEREPDRAKQEGKLDLAGLTEEQVSYSRAVYGHLRALTEGFKRASKIVHLAKEDNGLEAWRRLVRRFDPQNPQVHAMQLQGLVMWGANHAVKSIADVPQALDEFERAMDDYDDVTGELLAVIAADFDLNGIDRWLQVLSTSMLVLLSLPSVYYLKCESSRPLLASRMV